MKREGTKRGRKRENKHFLWPLLAAEKSASDYSVRSPDLSRFHTFPKCIHNTILSDSRYSHILPDPKDLIAKCLYTSSFKYICSMRDPVHLILICIVLVTLLFFRSEVFFFLMPSEHLSPAISTQKKTPDLSPNNLLLLSP